MGGGVGGRNGWFGVKMKVRFVLMGRCVKGLRGLRGCVVIGILRVIFGGMGGRCFGC